MSAALKPTPAELAARVIDLAAQEKAIAAERKAALDALVMACRGTPTVIGDHRLERTVRRGAVDYARICRDLLPALDPEPYRKPPYKFWQLC